MDLAEKNIMENHPSLLSLATSLPPYCFEQQEIEEKMISVLSLDENERKKVKNCFQNSSIRKRYIIHSDFKKPSSEWHFWGSDFPKTVPTMTERNLFYKKEAVPLAIQSAKKAIESWGGDPSQLTHVISISCTGVVAPGIEFELMLALNLNRSIQRYGINFMGCFGAFKGLAVAQAFAKENPSHRILVVCTELCSLHLQADLSHDNLLGNTLFSDGSAAVIVGCHPKKNEKSMWQIIRNKSYGLEKSIDKMSWEASDTGFLMKLSPYVPVLLGRQIKSFTDDFLGSEVDASACNWAIHPGGKSIIQAIEKAMELQSEQTGSSWHVLREYGNMSSATFLFVLEHLYQQNLNKEWTFGVGFGPGLSLEAILLQRPLSS